MSAFTKSLLGIAICSALHLMLFFAAFSVSFSLGMARFDTGGDATALEAFSDTAFSILSFPGYQLAQRDNIHNNAAEWLVVGCNSALWGMLIYNMFLLVRHRIRASSYRVSLRTLLIVTTVVAVVLGLIYWGAR